MLKTLWTFLWGEGRSHEWDTVTKTSSPPCDLSQVDSFQFDVDELERLLRGSTEILQVCKKCGDHYWCELIGR